MRKSCGGSPKTKLSAYVRKESDRTVMTQQMKKMNKAKWNR